jgi:xanthine dehydrogenase accessory factor
MDIFEEIVIARKRNEQLVLATVVQTSGSAPRHEGARMLVRPDGSSAGTIGGGAIEKKVIEEALTLMKGGNASLQSYELKEIGMACGGGMSVFVEPLRPLPQLLIFGAGHIGTCIAQIGRMLDFHVTVVDNRQEYANRERLPFADEIIAEDYESAIHKAEFNDQTYIVILTHRHAHDIEILEKCVGRTWCYLGMIGSRAKVARALDQLRSSGVPQEIVEQIHSPIGLKIGANTPAEIAISIMAEIVQVRSKTIEREQRCPSGL